MSSHSEIWEFGPGKEFADFNSAITALNDHFAGGPFTSDQFLLGTPSDGPYRDIEQLNDKVFPFVFNGYKLVISSADTKNRIKFSGKRIVPGNTFLKYLEDQEPAGPVWKTNWLQTQPITSYNELYEDGILLTEKLSIGEVEETPGSYFVDVDRMMYVHARDSSRVRISGQYEFTINSNIFRWTCFDLNDQPKNLTILDVDFEHSLEACIRLERNLFNLTSFDGFTVLNCRFKSNHRFIEGNGASNGIVIKYSSFIEDSNLAVVDSGILFDSVGNVTIKHNYIKTYDDSWSILVNSINGITDVSENIIINGEVGLYGGDQSNFERNLFIRSNNAGNNGMALKSTSPINNIIGNAFIGFNNNTWYVDTGYNTGIYNFQNNTVWTELGANQVLFVNVRDDATINSRLNLISIKGIIYDGPSLGTKVGNVYLMDNAPLESKSRSASYRNVFSRTYSYNASIDAIDIIPVDDICKSILRRDINDPENLDVTGAVTPCHITAGCIQVNYTRSKLESFRWLPDWITEVSLPDDLVFQNYNAYSNKNRRFNAGCEGAILPTDPPTLELLQQIFAPVFHVNGAEVTISIVPTPPACEILYTNDGSTPNTSSLHYSGETLYIYQDLTLKARGYILNEALGPVTSIDILAPAADPYFQITTDGADGYLLSLYSNDGWVSEIHYTTNGVDPTINDPVWNINTPSVVMGPSVTYKARAFGTGRVPSNVVTQVYTATNSPVFNPLSGSATSVELTCSTPDSSIYYKLVAEAPTVPATLRGFSLNTQYGPGKFIIGGYNYPSWGYFSSSIECIELATYVSGEQGFILYWDTNGVQHEINTPNGVYINYTTISKTGSLVTQSDTLYSSPITITSLKRIFTKAYSLTDYPSPEVNSSFIPISLNLEVIDQTYLSHYIGVILVDSSGNNIIIGEYGTWGSPGSVLTSPDRGTTLTYRGRPANSSYSYIGSGCSNSDNSTAYLGTDGYAGIFKSTDSGATWSLTGAPTQKYYCMDCSIDGVCVFAVGNNGTIQRSLDSGNSWETVSSSRQWFGICCSDNGSIVYAVNYEGEIWKSNNYGATFTQIGTRPASVTRIDCSSNGQKVIMCSGRNSSGILELSDNGGTSWYTVENIRKWGIVKSSKDGQVLLASEVDGFIYLSYDRGLTWISSIIFGTWQDINMDDIGSNIYAITWNGSVYRNII